MGKILGAIRTAPENLQNTSPIFRNGISDTPVRTYLRSETGMSVGGHIRKYDGEPFMPHHIVDAVVDQISGHTTISVPYQEVIV